MALYRIGNQVVDLPAVAEQQATIGGPPIPEMRAAPPDSGLWQQIGQRALEALRQQVLPVTAGQYVAQLLGNQVFPQTATQPADRPSLPIPGTERSFDWMGGAGLLADMADPALIGATGAAKASIPGLMALMRPRTAAKEAMEVADKLPLHMERLKPTESPTAPKLGLGEKPKPQKFHLQVNDFVEVSVPDNPRRHKIDEEINRLKKNNRLTEAQRKKAIESLSQRRGGSSVRPGYVISVSEGRVRVKFVGADGNIWGSTFDVGDVIKAEDETVKEIIKQDINEASRSEAARRLFNDIDGDF